VELIAEQGFSATTVDDIALRAKVAKGTVYYNFASKTALFESCCGTASACSPTPSGRRWQACRPARRWPPWSVRSSSTSAGTRPFAQLLLSEMWRTNREWQQTLILLREQAIGVIAETVQAGVDSGDLPADLDVRVASSALFGVGLVVAVDWLVFQPERSIEDVEESLLAIVRRVG